jgi:hypothetical protein
MGENVSIISDRSLTADHNATRNRLAASAAAEGPRSGATRKKHMLVLSFRCFAPTRPSSPGGQPTGNSKKKDRREAVFLAPIGVLITRLLAALSMSDAIQAVPPCQGW